MEVTTELIRKMTRERIQELIPEATKITRQLNCWYFNIGWRLMVASQPEGKILLQSRIDLETAKKKIAELTRERDELRELSRWIPVSEKLPDDDFLGAYIRDEKVVSIEVMASPKRGYMNEDGKFSFFALWGRRPCRVTHWKGLSL